MLKLRFIIELGNKLFSFAFYYSLYFDSSEKLAIARLTIAANVLTRNVLIKGRENKGCVSVAW